jgi:hypothetical protein
MLLKADTPQIQIFPFPVSTDPRQILQKQNLIKFPAYKSGIKNYSISFIYKSKADIPKI